MTANAPSSPSHPRWSISRGVSHLSGFVYLDSGDREGSAELEIVTAPLLHAQTR